LQLAIMSWSPSTRTGPITTSVRRSLFSAGEDAEEEDDDDAGHHDGVLEQPTTRRTRNDSLPHTGTLDGTAAAAQQHDERPAPVHSPGSCRQHTLTTTRKISEKYTGITLEMYDAVAAPPPGTPEPGGGDDVQLPTFSQNMGAWPIKAASVQTLETAPPLPPQPARPAGAAVGRGSSQPQDQERVRKIMNTVRKIIHDDEAKQAATRLWNGRFSAASRSREPEIETLLTNARRGGFTDGDLCDST
jgi:hypothetical protein